MFLPPINATMSVFFAIPYTALFLFIQKMIVKGPGEKMPMNTGWIIWGEIAILLTVAMFLFYRKNK